MRLRVGFLWLLCVLFLMGACGGRRGARGNTEEDGDSASSDGSSGSGASNKTCEEHSNEDCPTDRCDACDSLGCVQQGTKCPICDGKTDQSSCEAEGCEWYFCTGWETTPLGCQPPARPHSELCRGPCEYWDNKSDCNTALGCEWFTDDRCRNSTVVGTRLSEEVLSSSCHDQTNHDDCLGIGGFACVAVECEEKVPVVTRFACWVVRNGGDEVREQGCSEYKCENLLLQSLCEDQGGRCAWTDGWCHTN